MNNTDLRDALRVLVRESLDADIPEPARRDVGVDARGQRILAVIGPRRAGKTWFCYQLMRELLAAGVPRENLLYVDFEDERLYPLRGGELTALWDVYLESPGVKPEKGLWCFLDEIQNVPYWSKWVRRVTERDPRVHVVTTGSSSKLLSTEIATELRGRSRTAVVYPYSLREFLRACGEDPGDPERLLYGGRRAAAARLTRDFMLRGGFPGVVGRSDYREILQEYYRTMYTRDMMERFRIKNTRLFEDFLKLQISRFASLSSVSNIAKDLRSLGHDCGKNTLTAYLGYAKDIFLLFEAPIFSPKVRNQMLYPRKVYGIDQGLLNAIRFSTSEDRGRLLENMVHLELRRRGFELFYFSGRGECDFVARRGGRVERLFQSCWSMAGRETSEREIRSLLEAMDAFRVREGSIVTDADSAEHRFGKRRISVVPFARWALAEF